MTEHNCCLSYVLRGSQGETGPAGPQGETGPAGPAGDSAYQIWLANGNAGTEQDFLESMAAVTRYPNRAAAEADSVPAPVQVISVATPTGHTLMYARGGGGNALTTADGGQWGPFDRVYPDHYGENSQPGTTDMEPHIQAALDDHSVVHFLPAVYGIYRAIQPRSRAMLIGAGMWLTIIRMQGDHNQSGIDVRDAGANPQRQVTVMELTLDGNKQARTPTGGNGFIALSSANVVDRCRLINWPNAGALFDGQNHPVWGNTVMRSIIDNNGGVGISNHSAPGGVFEQNTFTANGKENLTIDGTSHNCRVVNNKFNRCFGGCGNIGWDAADNTLIADNIIDNENDTTVAFEFRVGICINSNIDAVVNGKIANNIIANCPAYGIYARNRTGTGGSDAGRILITGNNFAGCGTDLRVEDTITEISVQANQFTAGFEFSDNDHANIRMSAGEVAWSVGLAANETQNGGDTFEPVVFNQVDQAHNCQVVNGEIFIPVPGLYSITVALRTNGLVSGSEASVRMVLPGGDKVQNFEVGDVVAHEVQMTVIQFLNRGVHRIDTRQFGTAGNYNIVAGNSTRWQGALIG